MKQVSRVGGKRIFKTSDSFHQYEKEQIAMFERSRAVRPSVTRAESILRGKRTYAIRRSGPSDYVWSEVRMFSLMQDPRYTPWTFSLVHPTRGRPEQAIAAMKMWVTNCSSHNNIEYILSLDLDDASNYLNEVVLGLGKLDLKIAINPNTNVVEALNVGARLATGKVIIYLSDDLECPPCWDTLIQEAVAFNADRQFALFVFDGNRRDLQTQAILSKLYYDRWGYIYYPEYKSMCADDDYMARAIAAKVVIDGTHLTFKHNHYSVGGMPWDATYAAENSSDKMAWGRTLLEKRRRENWGVK